MSKPKLLSKSLKDRNELIEKHINLVPWVINNKLHINNRDPYYDDLIGVGNLRLVISASNYDESLGEFSTYATDSIYSDCLGYYLRNLHTRFRYHHKVPIEKAKELGIRSKDYINSRSLDNESTHMSNSQIRKLLDDHPQWLSAQVLSEELGITYYSAFSMIMTLYPFIELDEDASYEGRNGNKFKISDCIEDRTLLRELDDVVNAQGLNELVSELMSLVKPIHKSLVEDWLIDTVNGYYHTQTYYGNKYNITRQYVCKVFKYYKSKFRDYLSSRKDEFYE